MTTHPHAVITYADFDIHPITKGHGYLVLYRAHQDEQRSWHFSNRLEAEALIHDKVLSQDISDGMTPDDHLNKEL